MNKRFSTLLAAALVAGGFSVNGQVSPTVPITTITGSEVTEIVTTPVRNYMLTTSPITGSDQTIADAIQVTTVNGILYAQKTSVAANSADANAQLWNFEVKSVAGSNRFILRNKATGMTLSFDPKNAIQADATGTLTMPTGAASIVSSSLENASANTEWNWVANQNAPELSGSVALTCAFRTDSTMAVLVDGNGWLYAYKYANNNIPSVPAGTTQLAIQAIQPGTITMSASDLNVLGDGANTYFTLSTNKTGLVGAGELMGKKFQAEEIATAPGYVYFKNLDADGVVENKYAYVDTAFYAGSATNADRWYKFANTKKVGEFGGLKDEAFRFMVNRNLFADSVAIYVDPSGLMEYTASANPSKWQTPQSDTDIQGYVRVSAVKLTPTTEVLTLYTEGEEPENLLFAVSAPEADATLTTVGDNVYFIKNNKGQYLAKPIYKAQKDYTATAEWVTVNADEQTVAHMPAYQWVILQDKTTDKFATTSSVSIYNREFNKGDVADYATIQLYKKNAAAEYLYGAIAGADSLEFVAVPTTALSDTLLGYKNFEEEDMLVNRYTFNYLHAYANDKFLAKSEKDSLATVLDGKQAFVIEKSGDIADYGYIVTDAVKARIAGLKQLRRQAYIVSIPAKSALNLGWGANTENKFALSSNLTATKFWFKENNDLKGDDNCYHAMIVVPAANGDYSKAGVTDDDLSATLKHQVYSETRTSAFLIAPYDAPLYRRFNSEKLEGNVGDAADTLRFVEKYRNEYLQVEANPNFTVKGIDFLGIYTPDFTKDGKSFIVDTAFVNRWNGNIKPQYLISIDRVDQAFEAGEMCPVCKEIVANGGTRPANCPHDKAGKAPFHMGKYLVNFADSVNHAADKANYGWKGYTRAGFVKAAHMGDSLYILTGQFADVTLATFDTAAIHKAVKEGKYAKEYVVDLAETADAKHQNVTWAMRFVDPENAAAEVEENRSFLMESGNTYNHIAPTVGSWLKMQNGCLVISGSNGSTSTFDQFTDDDDALIFNVEQGAADDIATDNETIATSEVAVIAGEGQVTIANAAGKKVVISNILGQVVANTVLTSDNAVIAAPQGVVVVAVEGEEAVKAIVK